MKPYTRDPETLARPWVRLGTPGLEHRVGGLEKDQTPATSATTPKTTRRCALRRGKIDGIAREIPPDAIDGPTSGDLLVVGWGSTYGSIRAPSTRKRNEGRASPHIHLRHLNPLPPDLGDILWRYKQVIVPEMNLGQLVEHPRPLRHPGNPAQQGQGAAVHHHRNLRRDRPRPRQDAATGGGGHRATPPA